MFVHDAELLGMENWRSERATAVSGRAATAASLALHLAGALMAAWAGELGSRPAEPVVVPVEMVVVKQPDEPPPQAAPPPEPVETAKPSPPAPPAPPQQPRARPKRPAMAEPKAAPSQLAPTSPTDGAPAPTMPAVTSDEGAPAPAVTEATSSTPARPQVAAASELDRFLAMVRQRLQANLDYPFTARKRRLAGVVHVRLHIGGDGGLAGTPSLVNRGSGMDILDKAALATVERAAPFPPPPDGTSLVIEVPIVFQFERG